MPSPTKDKHMKPNFRVIDFLPFIIMAACIAAAVYYAGVLYDAQKPIVNGILALAFLVLEYLYVSADSLVKNEPTRNLFTYPTGFRYLGFGILSVMLSYWALNEIIRMVFYLLKPFSIP